MLQYSTLVVLLALQYGYCSIVLEASTQKGIYVSDYCPKMKYCAEGSHVMCMYYNPNRVMGPRCTKPKNVSITSNLAEKLLEISNAVRSKIAKGKEKGKAGEAFPRGYGMFRLKWDSELATFAQVLANQCMLRHDMCRATKKFPDPGQTAGLVRFTYPDWIPIAKGTGLDKPGLTKQKLEYAVKKALRSWYSQKSMVTPGMLTSSPDWAENPSNQEGRLYLDMIYGPATHMGCGIAAYSEYAYYDNNAALNYNSIQIICNFSSRSRKGAPVYEVTPPSEVGYTIKCGCPAGMDEDEDCLCYESIKSTLSDVPIGRESCSNKDLSCKPAVVLLPIFTVEDAPLDKLHLRQGIEEKKESDMEILDLYQSPVNNTILYPMTTNPRTYNQVININDRTNLGSFIGPPVPISNNKMAISEPIYQQSIYPNTAIPAQDPVHNVINEVHNIVSRPLSLAPKPHIYDIKDRFFNKKPIYLGPNSHDSKPNILSKYNHQKQKKESVFAKVPTFDLSKRPEHTVKPNRNIMPRKDFSKAKSLVKSYLDRRRHSLENKKETSKSTDFLHFVKENGITTTEPYKQSQNSAEEKVITYHSLLNNKLEPKSTTNPDKDVCNELESESFKEKSNDNLMKLLDKLEQEVKHIELDRSKKEIFDAKLRKIYGTVVRKTNRESDFSNVELSNNERHKSSHNKYLYDTNESHTKTTKLHYDALLESDKINENDKARNRANDLLEFNKKYEIDGIRNHIKRKDIKFMPRIQHDVTDPFISKRDEEHIIQNYNKIKDYDIEHKHSYTDNVKSKHMHNTFNDANEIKPRDMYNEKDSVRREHIYSEAGEKKTIKELEQRDNIELNDHEDDLEIERRKFYQEKLDNIARKAHNARKSNGIKHHGDTNSSPLLRPVIRPSRNDNALRPGKTRANPFYVPDRARFLHGF